MRRIIIRVVTIALGLLVRPSSGADPQVQAELDAAYIALTSRTGQAYLAARDRLLLMDGATVRAYLESKRQSEPNVVLGLCVDAVLLRLSDEELLRNSLKKALASAAEDRSHLMRNPDGGPGLPRSGEVADLLVQYLGDGALPFATELLVKDLARDWDDWQVYGLLEVLRSYRRTMKSKPRTGGAEYGQIKDARAGQVLLWVAEHHEDDLTAAIAAGYLRGFATENLFRQGEETRSRSQSDKVRARLSRGIKGIASELREIQYMAARTATQPTASAPSP